MSYVDAYLDQAKDMIHVVERVNGNRVYKDYPAEYVFYYDDKKGAYTTIYKTKVTKVSFNSKKQFLKELQAHTHHRVWESDCRPLFACINEKYKDAQPPKMNVAFFDIESDWDDTLGFAPVTDPFNKITAISVYQQWNKKMLTFSIPPKTISMDTAIKISNEFEDCYIFKSEKEMLLAFLASIEDADILSGWNSESYDIPYTVGRILMVLGKEEAKKLCLWGKSPTKKELKKYGSDSITYTLSGRVHLDYMQLYQKYTFEERHSYSLNAIGEYEECGQKTDYTGTLDQLYNQDYRLFLKYNRQDVNLINDLDLKLKFIDLANIVAHECGVLLPDILGTVVATDQAIINEAHLNGLIVPNKKKTPDDNMISEDNEAEEKAAGAYVATPKTGMQKYIGLTDINSLYPNTIRTLNMGIDTLIGQLDQHQMTVPYIENKINSGSSFAEAWDGLFGSLEYTAMMNQENVNLTINWENGEKTTDTAKNIYKLIFESNKNIIVSANGTLFTSEFDGIIPRLLAKWYTERQLFQKKMEMVDDLENGIEINDLSISSPNSYDVILPVDVPYIVSLIENNNSTELTKALRMYGLIVKDKKIYAKDYDVLKYSKEFWNKKQHVKKIQLNALYGCLLNRGSRFNDQRLGQSITLCGRAIAHHMDSTINEILTGEYNYCGDAIIYGDTDSCMFSAWHLVKDKVESGEIEWSDDICIDLYKQIADHVNESFPEMAEAKFHTPNGSLIKCGLELVGKTGLFIKKKRYAIMMYYKDGERYDLLSEEKAKKKKVVFQHGKVKAMGLDLKRSDTPKLVQEFLMSVLIDVLIGTDKSTIFEKISDFKVTFNALPAWEKGTPKRVNNLTDYTAKEKTGKKVTIPGHVRGSINYNRLKRLINDNHSMDINDGSKVIVCKLKENQYGFTSIAYPVDILEIPQWFKELPFDDDSMEEGIVDKKLDNLLGILNWDIHKHTHVKSTFNSLFDQTTSEVEVKKPQTKKKAVVEIKKEESPFNSLFD